MRYLALIANLCACGDNGTSLAGAASNGGVFRLEAHE
jgi:hypothetical protein